MIRHLRRACGRGETCRVGRRRAWAGVGTLAAVLLVAGFVIVDRAKYMVRETIGTFATVAVTDASRGAYRLEVGDIRLEWWRRTVTVVSARLTTDTAINIRRGSPLPHTRLILNECAIRGLHLLTLVASRGLSAESMGCRSVVLETEVLARPAAPETHTHVGPMRDREPGKGFLVLQRSLKLPRAVPRIRIRSISFPDSRVRFRMDRMEHDPLLISLDHFRWYIDNMVIDPGDSAAWQRPLFSDQVRIAATNFTAEPGDTRRIRVGRMQASLTDSIIELRDIVVERAVTAAEERRLKPDRRTFMQLSVARVAAAGLDVATFARGEGVEARKLEVDSVNLEIDMDKRPRRRSPSVGTREAPQQWLSNEFGTLAIDTITVTGDLTLRERRPAQALATLTFNHIEATAANVRHVSGRRSTDEAMTLVMSARLQNAGLLRASFEVPLDAPRLDMRYSGSLGAMNVAALNRFVEPAARVRITSGRVTNGIRFQVDVRDGVATGTITPLYDQLRVKVMRQESHGILGSRGFFGSVARRVASFVANERIIRDDNPDNPGEAVRVGRINRRFAPGEKLPKFVWEGLRDGLLSVIQK